MIGLHLKWVIGALPILVHPNWKMAGYKKQNPENWLLLSPFVLAPFLHGLCIIFYGGFFSICSWV